MKMRTIPIPFILLPFLAAAAIVGCGRGKGGNANAEAEQRQAAVQADWKAKWERHVTYVDSVRRADHSPKAYLSQAWICFNEEDHARALRYTDSVLTLVTDAVPQETINNARYLRSLCFDRLGMTERSIEEMKAVVASEEQEGPEMCHESKLNLAYYYLKMKRYEEAIAALPDSASAGGRQLWQMIQKAKEEL